MSAKPWPPLDEAAYKAEAVDIAGQELVTSLANVKLLVFDCDGVLTSGKLIYSEAGETLKAFHSRDGLGLVMCRMAGLKLAMLTGRNSQIVKRRCSELRFDVIKLGRFDKVAALNEILAETGCDPSQTLYMGDDLVDLPAMYSVGLPVTVPEAPVEVLDAAVWTTSAAGGEGAVRQIAELVLKSAGLFGLALERLCDKAWHPTQSELSAGNDEQESGS